jgi:hypothetical protein
MADRYWVGGTANWDGTAGTKWAATSGGAGGQSVPTSADDVFFTNLSTGTVTLAAGNTGAKSINCTGFAGTITGTAAISVAGSVTLSAAMTYTHTGTMTFTGTATLITAGKTFSGVTVDGSGITVTLGDALNTGGRALTVTQGTFATANYNVTPGDFNSTGSLTRDIQLGSSTVTTAGGAPFNITGSGLTFNAGTSQINHTALTASLNASISLTFHNYSFTNASAGSRSITASHTFNNLTLVASATGLSQLSLSADQTINGTFTCAGSSAIARGFVRSNTIGTVRTITAAAVSANDCDFLDITLAGAAAGASPTRAGDCGGNSGITFPAAKTVFRVGTDTTWQGSSSWALTSGGGGSNDNFPLPQDTVVINNDTALTGTLALGLSYNIGAVDCSTRTTGITINHSSTQNRYGSYTLGSGVTVSGTSAQTFSGRGTMVFTTAGKVITFTVFTIAGTGTLRLGDAYTSSLDLSLTSGTFDANNNNVTIRSLNAGGSGTKTITLGSGLWTVTTTWSAQGTGTTVSPSTATISMTSASAKTFQGGGYSWPTLNQGGAGILTIAQSNTFANITDTVQPATVRLTAGTTQTISTFSMSGTSGNLITLDTTTAGTRANINLTNITSGIDYLAVKDIAVSDPDKFYVGANSTDSGNNVNVYFTDTPVVPPSSTTYFKQVFSPVFHKVFSTTFS